MKSQKSNYQFDFDKQKFENDILLKKTEVRRQRRRAVKR
jgi:hypothetical protein